MRSFYVISAILIGLLCFSSCILAADADYKHGKGETCNCDEVNIKGMFVCPHYLVVKDMTVEEEQKCCLNDKNESLLFVDEEGNIYLSIFCEKCNVTKEQAAVMAMKKIMIKGKVFGKGGMKGIHIDSVEKITE